MIRGTSSEHGEQEQAALQHGVAVIGWNELRDLSAIKTREELVRLLEQTYPDKKKSVPNWTGQIWAFLMRIEVNDLVVLPLKTQSAIAVGKVTGGYAYQTGLATDVHHTRQVRWLRTDDMVGPEGFEPSTSGINSSFEIRIKSVQSCRIWRFDDIAEQHWKFVD